MDVQAPEQSPPKLREFADSLREHLKDYNFTVTLTDDCRWFVTARVFQRVEVPDAVYIDFRLLTIERHAEPIKLGAGRRQRYERIDNITVDSHFIERLIASVQGHIGLVVSQRPIAFVAE